VDRKTILLVEDEAIIALDEKASLAKYGFEVLISHTGEDAVKACESNHEIDLILMDIDLGRGMDGTEAAKIILKERDIPVLFLSSHAEPEIVEKTQKITSYGYVVKGSSSSILDVSIKMAFKLFDANQTIKNDAATIAERNRLLESLIEKFPGRVFWKDTNSVYLGCNTEEARAFGLQSPREMIGKTDQELHLGEDKAGHYRDGDRYIIETGRPIQFVEEYRLNEEGEQVSEISSKLPLFDANGKVSLIFGMSIDITERKRLEDGLTASNEMLQKVLDSIPQFICWKNRESEFIGCNKNYANMVGLRDSQSITGMTDWELPWKKEEVEAFLKDDEFVMGNDAPKYNIIEQASDAIGRTRYLETNKVPLHDIQGNVSGILVAISDVTDRKITEDKQAREQQQLQTIMDESIDHIYFKDRQSRFVRASKSHARYFDLGDPQQLQGKTDFDFFTQEHAQQAYDDEQNIMRTGESLTKEERETWKNKADSWTFSIKQPMKDENGDIVGIFGISRDITERRFLEEKLVISNEMLQKVLDSMPQSICWKNRKAEFLGCNGNFANFYGLSDIQWLLGKTETDLPSVREGFAKIQDDDLWVMETDTPQYRIMHKNIDAKGREVWLETNKVPLHDAAGNVNGILVAFSDITERKETEEKIRALLDEKELILKEVHHRIKNNMGNIQSLLLLQAGASEDRRLAASLEAAAVRVQSMMLLYNKLYLSSSFAAVSIRQYLPALIEQVIANFSSGNTVRVMTDIADFDLSSKILQPLGIIMNELITNVMKYAFAGSKDPTIEVSASRVAGHVVVSIRDNGVGMPDSVDLERSTGFGLMLVKALTEQLRGKVRLERERGTRFIIEFES
jgi:PAS domain S-box-containing protein